MKKESRRRIHRALLLAPLLYWFGWFIYQQATTPSFEQQMFEPNGQVWRAGPAQFKSTVTRSGNGEVEDYAISIADQNNRIVYTNRASIDWDMFGGGFVKAMQADGDPDLEIAVVDRRARGNYYLDVSESGVVEVPFDRAAPSARELVTQWMHYKIEQPYKTTLLVTLTVVYYILYFPVYWSGRGVLWLARRISAR